MKRRNVRALLAMTGCVVLLAGFGAAAQDSPAFGDNLVTNGDAEARAQASLTIKNLGRFASPALSLTLNDNYTNAVAELSAHLLLDEVNPPK